jgi:tRNA (guanine-N7-)-methyltransferase
MALDPARPQQTLTEDGKRLREVLSYSRRGSRFTPRQQAAWTAHHESWLVPAQAFEQRVVWDDWFERSAPLIIEIGSGVGEATAQLARDNPQHNVLSVEVWRPGVAEGMGKVAEADCRNVRFTMVDAVWLMAEQVGSASVAELVTFFPDPWHKKRHHKRRLINPHFSSLAADRLSPGGKWRLATDWAAYAEQIDAVLDAQPTLIGGRTPRWDGRPLTRFERKGLAQGREIVDFSYQRAL